MARRESAIVTVKNGVYVAKGTLVDATTEALEADVRLRQRRAPGERGVSGDDGLSPGHWETVGIHRCMPPKRLLRATVALDDDKSQWEELVTHWSVRLPRTDEERHLISGALLNLFGLIGDALEKKRSVIVHGHVSGKSGEWSCNRQAAMLASLLVADAAVALASPEMAELRSVAMTFEEFWKNRVTGSALAFFRIQSILREPERRWVREGGSGVAPGFRACHELITAATPISEYESVDFLKVTVVVTPKWHQLGVGGQEECNCRIFVTQGRNTEDADFHYVAALKKALWMCRSRKVLGCWPRVELLPEQACLALNASQLPASPHAARAGAASHMSLCRLLLLLEGRPRLPLPGSRVQSSSRRLTWASFEHDASRLLAAILGTRGYVWEPANHWLLPVCMQEGVITLLLCHRFRPDSLPASLPMEVLFMVFTEYVKSVSAFMCHRAPENGQGR